MHKSILALLAVVAAVHAELIPTRTTTSEEVAPAAPVPIAIFPFEISQFTTSDDGAESKPAEHGAAAAEEEDNDDGSHRPIFPPLDANPGLKKEDTYLDGPSRASRQRIGVAEPIGYGVRYHPTATATANPGPTATARPSEQSHWNFPYVYPSKHLLK